MYSYIQNCIYSWRVLLLLLLLLYVQAFPIRETDKIKQAKYRKYLNCGHLSSKQITLFVCVNY